MNVRTMQRIDYWVGVPLCLLCSVVHSVLSLFVPRRKRATSPSKLLYIELSEMGSAILAYPTLRQTRELYPDAEIHFLIFRRNVESIELLGILDKNHIHVIEDQSLARFLVSSLGTLIKLRLLRFDVVFDMELFSRCTALMSFFLGAPCSVGFHKYREEGLYRGNFLTHRVGYNPHFHISQNFASLLEATRHNPLEEPLVKAPIPFERKLPRLEVTTEARVARERLRALLPDVGCEPTLVLINPDPGLLELRGWPVESYRLLAERLLAWHPAVLVGIIGLERSVRYHEAISRGSSAPRRIVNLCGITASMRELLGLFSLSAALVSNDSGPGHFAPLVGLPGVILFGPETPRRYAPLGDTTASLYAHLACSPCFSAQNHRQSACTRNRCLEAISVDEVFDATIRAIQSRALGAE
jgi:ADP-heptose:LPS heptosyltransferase